LMLFGTLAVGIIAGFLLAFPRRRQQQKNKAQK
jgi:hypothetical protein